jgi:pilus assembly protein Flp/PilA
MRRRDAASRRETDTTNGGDAATTGTSHWCRYLGGGIMSNLINFVKTFSNKEDGQDLLEYALLVALIALIAIGAVGMAGGSVNAIFQAIAGSLAAAA